MAAILWALIVILIVVWLVGFILVHIAGPLIHLLLLVALILIVWNQLSSSRRTG